MDCKPRTPLVLSWSDLVRPVLKSCAPKTLVSDIHYLRPTGRTIETPAVEWQRL